MADAASTGAKHLEAADVAAHEERAFAVEKIPALHLDVEEVEASAKEVDAIMDGAPEREEEAVRFHERWAPAQGALQELGGVAARRPAGHKELEQAESQQDARGAAAARDR